MKKTVYDELWYTRDLWQEKPAEGGAGTYEVSGSREEFSVRVVIDMDALARMAGRAARNKRGTSTDGLLEVKMTGRSRGQRMSAAPGILETEC